MSLSVVGIVFISCLSATLYVAYEREGERVGGGRERERERERGRERELQSLVQCYGPFNAHCSVNAFVSGSVVLLIHVQWCVLLLKLTVTLSRKRMSRRVALVTIIIR